MGRSRRPPAKKVDSDSDEGVPLKSVVFISSSDDEEANKDLSLEIVERAMKGDSKRKRAEVNGVISLTSGSSEDMETNFEIEDKSKKKKKKSKGKSKNKNEVEAEAVEAVDAAQPALEQEELVGTADSIVTEVNDVSNNVVLRKLLRGPRYFDPGEKNSGACFNCGNEGHNAIDCTMERRKKPCFVCGMFGHNAKRCTQGQDCFICKRRGHIAKNCPEKHNRTTQDSTICLRCGDLGHDMLLCKNDYPPDDLKEIQCYVCKNYGHLCCADFVDDGPREVSCYNCAQPGHTGLGCAKPRGEIPESADVAPAKLCYKCGEEGHFVRGCTKKLNRSEGGSSTPRKPERREGGFSTPRKISSKNKDRSEFRSVPRDFGKAAHKNKKKKFEYEDRWHSTSGKSRTRGGWIVDDPGDSPRINHTANSWKSPAISTPRWSHRIDSSASSGGHRSSSRSYFQKHGSFLGTPNSIASTSIHRHNGYSTPQNGYSSPRQSYYGRSQSYYG